MNDDDFWDVSAAKKPSDDGFWDIQAPKKPPGETYTVNGMTFEAGKGLIAGPRPGIRDRGVPSLGRETPQPIQLQGQQLADFQRYVSENRGEGENIPFYINQRLPIVGHVANAAMAAGVSMAAERARSGQATETDLRLLARVAAQAQREGEKGVGRHIFDIVSGLPAVGVEWTLAGPHAAVERGSAGAVLGSVAGQALARTGSAMGAAQVASGAAQRMAPHIGPDGQILPGEGPGESLAKSIAARTIENAAFVGAGGPPGTVASKGAVEVAKRTGTMVGASEWNKAAQYLAGLGGEGSDVARLADPATRASAGANLLAEVLAFGLVEAVMPKVQQKLAEWQKAGVPPESPGAQREIIEIVEQAKAGKQAQQTPVPAPTPPAVESKSPQVEITPPKPPAAPEAVVGPPKTAERSTTPEATPEPAPVEPAPEIPTTEKPPRPRLNRIEQANLDRLQAKDPQDLTAAEAQRLGTLLLKQAGEETGKMKEGSIRWEAKERGVSRETIRKERVKSGQTAQEELSKAEQLARKADQARMDEQGRVMFSGLPVEVERSRADTIPEPVRADLPEVERRLANARGTTGPGVLSRVKEVAGAAYRGLTRAQPNLPNNAEWAPANEGFRLLKDVPSIASDQVNRALAAVVDPIGPKQLTLLERKLVADNLLASVDRGEPLRFGFPDRASVEAYKNKLDALVAQTPEVQQAIAARQAIKRELVQEAVDFGILKPEALDNEAYYHQMVSSQMQHDRFTGGSKPMRQKRSFQKERVKDVDSLDEAYDYNTSFLEAESRWMTELKMEVAKEKLIREHFEPYDIIDQLKAEAKANGKSANDWEGELRNHKGYDIWSPEPGNIFYRATTVPEKVVAEFTHALLDGAEAKAEITPEDLRSALAMGGIRRPMVIPEPLAKQLRESLHPRVEGAVARAANDAMGAWKLWTLLNPKRALGYMMRNLTGDIEPIVAAEPKALTKVDRAIRELRGYYGKKLSLSGDLKTARDLSVVGSSLTAQEIPDVKDLHVFRRLYDTPGKLRALADIPARYLEKVKSFNEFRESVGRYAAFLHYKERLQSGEKFHYGGAKKEVVDALLRKHGVDVAAAHLARNLLGDYGNLTQFGTYARRKLAPFWSWMEVNFKRWPRLTENAFRDAGAAGVGKAAALKAGTTLAANALRLGGLYGAVWTWNNTVMANEEKDLSPEQRASLHVTLGRDKDGNVQTFNRVGSLSDFLEWFGFTEAVSNAEKVGAGQMGAGQLAKEMAKEPLNKAVSSLRPDLKTGAEVAFGMSAFPDVTKPRPQAGDVTVARALGLDDEYKAIKRSLGTGDAVKPGYLQRATGVQTTSPGQAAMSEITELRNLYMKNRGKDVGTFAPSKIAKMRDAALYGDRKAFDDAKKNYLASGGTLKSLRESLDNLDPVADRMSDKDRIQFVGSLTPAQREKLVEARKYAAQTRKKIAEWWLEP